MIPSKHSPAPWSAEFGDSSHRFVLVKDGDDRTVFYKYCSGSAQEADQDEANARLIAAAPKLLEACIALQMEARARGCGLRVADEAIAKATGSSDFHITERRA